MISESLYTPSPWQQRFANLKTHEALGAGAAGPGKTRCLLFLPFKQIAVEHARCLYRRDPERLEAELRKLGIPKEIPRAPGMPPIMSCDTGMEWGQSVGWALHLRRTLKQVEQTMAQAHRFFPQVDPGCHWDAQRTTWTFSSGYHYQFGHCKESSSWADYMGWEYTIELFDELNQFEEEQYDQIGTRLRTSDPVLALLLIRRAMSNPTMRREASDPFSTKDPGWVKRRFVDDCPEGGKILKEKIRLESGEEVWRTRIYLPARLSDNPDKAFVRQYEEQLQSSKPHIRQALLYGNWDAVVGAYWGEDWLPSVHTCDPFEVPYEWPIVRSMDWGFKKPGCVLWGALDEDDNLYIIRELYFVGKTDKEIAQAIRVIEEDMELWKNGRSSILGPADTQLWEQRGQSGLSMAQNMSRMGVN